MIQRIQTLWLLLAAICGAGLFVFDIYYAHVMVNGADTIQHLRANDHYPTMLIALVVTVLPLITIFMFKDRKRQRRMGAICIVAITGFVSLALARVNSFNNSSPAPTEGSYWIGAILPVVALVFIVMALRGISKDEKLVRSLDRLR